MRDFENGSLDIYCLNLSIITLITKEPDAKEMKKFHPIRASPADPVYRRPAKLVYSLQKIGFAGRYGCRPAKQMGFYLNLTHMPHIQKY